MFSFYLFRVFFFPQSKTRAYASDELIRMEPEEGIEKVVEALKTCQLYKDTYESYKANLHTFFKEEPVVEWQFQSSLIFSRVNQLIKRLKIVEVRRTMY